MTERLMYRLAWAVAALCMAPILAAALAALGGDLQTWRDVLSTVLPRYTANTLALVVIVGSGAAVIGTATAWLVTVYRFPGVRWLEVALVLPLAFPAYVLAYAYTYAAGSSRPRADAAARRHRLGSARLLVSGNPQPRRRGASMLTHGALSLRLSAGARLVPAAKRRTPSSWRARWGARRWRRSGRWRCRWRGRRSSGGVLLAIMETIADFGTVAFFNVQTFATGIYRRGFRWATAAAAAQLALCLLTFALLLAGLERAQRGRARRARARRRAVRGAGQAAADAAGGLGRQRRLPAAGAAGLSHPGGHAGRHGVGSGQSLLEPRYSRLHGQFGDCWRGRRRC